MNDTSFAHEMLALILAGGRGGRLDPLTQDRSKPMTPIGKYTLLDFSLATVRNSDIPRSWVFVQYMCTDILDHLFALSTESTFWKRFIRGVPPQFPDGSDHYLGSANAIYQNKKLLIKDPAELVAILMADQITKIDFRQVRLFHLACDAEFTIVGRIMPTEEARLTYGVMVLADDGSGRVNEFQEKPAEPATIPGLDNMCFASLGMYLSNKGTLLTAVDLDHGREDSNHDIGHNLVTAMIERGVAVYAYDFEKNIVPGEVRTDDGKEKQVHYWADAGTVYAYWKCVMDLIDIDPILNIHNKKWPLLSVADSLPMAKVITPRPQHGTNMPRQYLMAGGSIIDSINRLFYVMIGRNVHVQPGACVEKSILFDDSSVGEESSVRTCIVEEDVHIPPGCRIGYSVDDDTARGIYVSPEGIRVVTCDAQL